MKLEAVDKKKPALICVGTVAEIDNDRVRIEFDGYRGSGYWTVYYDRDLFQAGWCYANGYPLQPPGRFLSSLVAGLNSRIQQAWELYLKGCTFRKGSF